MDRPALISTDKENAKTAVDAAEMVISLANEKQSQYMMTRNDFMSFFRNDDQLNTLSADDRIEIFSQILTGNSDFTKKLLDNILSDYSVGHLEIIDHNDEKK